MGWFDGFPFVSREERERRRKDFEKRIAPLGLDEQRDMLKATLCELFPGIDKIDLVFTYYDAKDSYTKKETPGESEMAARQKMRRARWMDGRKETIFIRLIEKEIALTSLDDFPTAKDVLDGLFEE